MTTITCGSYVASSGIGTAGANRTCVQVNNAANGTGTINEIQVYASPNGGSFDLGSCSKSGSNFTTDAYVTLTAAINGNDFHAPGDFTAFAVTTGDYAYVNAPTGGGNADYQSSAGSTYYANTYHASPMSSVALYSTLPYNINVLLTGTTSGGGGSISTINGLTKASIGYIDGLAIASVGSINGLS